MNDNAFTLLELIVAIMLIGIIAVVSSISLKRDSFYEAQRAILSDIRYTQSLALRDSKHSFSDPKWQRRFWRIIFSTCTGGAKYYMIGSDFDKSGAINGYFSKHEAALDTVDGKPMWWYNAKECNNGGDKSVSSRIFLTHKYDIIDISSHGGCSSKYSKMGHLGFDHLGRPHYGFGVSMQPDNSSYIKSDCKFQFTFRNGKEFTIVVQPESGYAYLQNSNI